MQAVEVVGQRTQQQQQEQQGLKRKHQEALQTRVTLLDPVALPDRVASEHLRGPRASAAECPL